MITQATQRQHPRVLLRLPIEFAVTTPFEGAIMKTISPGGLCFATSTPPIVGTRLLVRFSVPSDVGPMNAVGVVVWTRPFRPQKAEVGVRFIGIREDNHARLQKFCAEHGTT